MDTARYAAFVDPAPQLFGRTGPPRDSAQLDLPLWPRGTLGEALLAFKAMKLRMAGIEASTLRDYEEYFNWITGYFGAACQLRDITFERLERVYHLAHQHLRGVTILKRFKHFLAAARYAADRRVIARDEVPALPPIPNDGRPGERALELNEFRQLRLALDGKFRSFADIVFWCGLHSKDVWSLKYSDLDPDFEWKDESGATIWRGRYLRRNHKTGKSPAGKPAWLPMEPEFREAAQGMLAEGWSSECLVVGRLSRVLHKWFDVAADRCGIPRVQPDRDLRRSFASMLAARGYSERYIQFAQGHAGRPRFEGGVFAGSFPPTVDDRHYVRLTDDFLIAELQLRRARMEAQK